MPVCLQEKVTLRTAGRELGKGGIDTEKTAFLVHETIYARGLCGKQK